MDKGAEILIRHIGQSGFRLQFGRTVIYLDPYLTDYVVQVEDESFRRMVQPVMPPGDIGDADWVLVSHLHHDHCDPETLLPISKASKGCSFMAPSEAADYLKGIGITQGRIVKASEEWSSLGPELKVMAVPAAHPDIERDKDGMLRCAGYVIEYKDRRIYHAGDTSPHDEIMGILKKLRPLHVVLLPVNERNYYRRQRGIIGNMSVREAFHMAEELDAEVMVPAHWDLFRNNSAYREEIELLYNLIRPGFELQIEPERV